MHNAIVRSVRRIDYSMLNNSWVKGSCALKKKYKLGLLSNIF